MNFYKETAIVLFNRQKEARKITLNGEGNISDIDALRNLLHNDNDMLCAHAAIDPLQFAAMIIDGDLSPSAIGYLGVNPPSVAPLYNGVLNLLSKSDNDEIASYIEWYKRIHGNK